MNSCVFCKRTINNKGSLVAHQKCCVENPNGKKYARSPDAGAQKGSIPHNKGISVGRLSYWDLKYPLEEVLVENSTYNRQSVKKRIIDNDVLPYICNICSLPPVWKGEPMCLILDHINGKNDDHRLENLRFVCHNCDSQLETYKGRNKKKKNNYGE